MNKATKTFDAVDRPKADEPAGTGTPASVTTVDTATQPVATPAQDPFIKGPFTAIPASDGVHLQPAVAAGDGTAQDAKKV